MTGLGWQPPPIDIEKQLSLYDNTSTVTNKINNLINNIYPINSIQIFNNNINPNNYFSNQTWELLNDYFDDNTIINNYFNTTDLNITVDNNGIKWLLLVSHNINAGSNYYTNTAQALSCKTAGKISNLYLLNQEHNILKNSKGQYEFKLEYPGVSSTGKNQWRQTSNPLMFDNIAYGSQTISTTWNTYQEEAHPGWAQGIGLGGILNPQCLLKGDLYCPYWWFAICSFQNYEGGIPGPGSIISGYTNLYVRVPGLETTDNFLSNYNFLNNHNCKYWKRIS